MCIVKTSYIHTSGRYEMRVIFSIWPHHLPSYFTENSDCCSASLLRGVVQYPMPLFSARSLLVGGHQRWKSTTLSIPWHLIAGIKKKKQHKTRWGRWDLADHPLELGKRVIPEPVGAVEASPEVPRPLLMRHAQDNRNIDRRIQLCNVAVVTALNLLPVPLPHAR